MFRNICLLLLLCSSAMASTKIKIYTDYYPPFSYVNDDRPFGVCGEVVEEVLKRTSIDATYVQSSFARAYRLSTHYKDIYQFCVAKTEEREQLFEWLGVVGTASHGIIGLKKSRIKVKSADDLYKYRVAATNEDIVEQYLRRELPGLQYEIYPSYKKGMELLLNGRVQLWAGNIIVGMHLAEELGFSKRDLELVYLVDELSVDYYLVTSRKSDKKSIKLLKKKFREVHQDGTYKRILRKYMLPPQ